MYHRDLETNPAAKKQHDDSHKAIAAARLRRVGEKRAEIKRKKRRQ